MPQKKSPRLLHDGRTYQTTRNDATRLAGEALEFICRMQQLHALGLGCSMAVANDYRQYARLLRKAVDVAEANADFYGKLAAQKRVAS